jgi:FkbM family methyltransferase
MKISEYKYRIEGDEKEIYFRNAPSSDYAVIHQIFQQKVYSLVGWEHKNILENYHQKNYLNCNSLIIDAGANIGASSIFFSEEYSNSLVVSIEPEKNNHTLLRLNTIDKKIITLEGAVGSEDGIMYLDDPGNGDVGFRVQSQGKYEVNVYSMNNLIEIGRKNGAMPFICKIDIEGGELELFSKNINWINAFALIIIELHDWMLPMQGSSKNFIEAISKLDFEILHKGENLFLFNKSKLAEYR